MTTTDPPPAAGAGTGMLLTSPLGADSLDRLLERAIPDRPNRMVDHGCGWGEVLLRALARVPDATGLGIEQHEPDVRRGEQAARDRGLDSRVTFQHGDSTDFREPADLLISIGAYQAFGDVAGALRVLRADLRPGGRAIFGAEYWASTPSPDALSHMWPGATIDDCVDLPASST